MKSTVINQTAINQEARFTQAFESYINALTRLDNTKSGNAAKVARMQYNNAVKHLIKVDPSFASIIEEAHRQDDAKEAARRNAIWAARQA
jgi:thiamine biosynthesis lipoprotein ApbE